MSKRAHVLIAAVAACLLVPFSSTAAGPADVLCPQNPQETEFEFFTGTARDLTVPENSFCIVIDSTITGNLIVSDHAGALVLNTSIGHDLIGNEESDVEVGLGTVVGHDIDMKGPGGSLRLELTTIAHDVIVSRPGTVQTGHNSPESPGGHVTVGRDFVIDGSPDFAFVFDGLCDMTVGRDLRVTNRSVTLGIGIGNTCAPNGLPSNTIGRDVIVTGNHALDGFFGPSSLNVGDNDVGRDLVFTDNTAVPGGALTVSGNGVGRDASCRDNSPAVIALTPNVAERSNTCG